MKNIKEKSINGIFWNLTQKYSNLAVRLVLGIILARLLSPADYGLIGMISVFFAFAGVFVSSGLNLAFIQKKNADDIDASTIFYFNLSISLFFYIIFWFLAPYISEFYEEEKLISLIRVMGIVLIVNSLSMIQLAKLTKAINFKKVTLISLASAIISGVVAIIFAYNNYGVWSLIIQFILGASINTLGLWVFNNWRPRFVFSLKSLKSMFSFSLWILFANILRSIFDNIYVLVIGKLYSSSILGFYTKAKQFQEIAAKQPVLAIGGVAFPVFTNFQSDKVALKRSMKKFMYNIEFFLAPILAILYVIASPLFLLALTEKWLPMVPFFQYLLIIGLFLPIQQMSVKSLSAIGKTRLNFQISILINVLRAASIIMLYRYGVIFIIIGEVVVSFLSIILYGFFTKKYVDYSFVEQIRDVFIVIFSAIVSAIISYLLVIKLDNIYIKICVGIVSVFICYFPMMYILDKNKFLATYNLVKNLLVKK